MTSRPPPSQSDASDSEDSLGVPCDLPSATPVEDSPLSTPLSTWQDIVSAIKLRFEGEMLPPYPRKPTCRVMDDSGFHQEEEDPVFCLPLFPLLLESFGFLQEDLRNPPKQGSSDTAHLPQGSYPQTEPLDREDKASLPPLGNSSFMFTTRPDSGLSNLLPPGKPGFPPNNFSLSEAQHLAQEKDLRTAITSSPLTCGGRNSRLPWLTKKPSPLLCPPCLY